MEWDDELNLNIISCQQHNISCVLHRKKPPVQYVRCEMEGCGTVLAHPRYLQVCHNNKILRKTLSLSQFVRDQRSMGIYPNLCYKDILHWPICSFSSPHVELFSSLCFSFVFALSASYKVPALAQEEICMPSSFVWKTVPTTEAAFASCKAPHRYTHTQTVDWRRGISNNVLLFIYKKKKNVDAEQ